MSTVVKSYSRAVTRAGEEAVKLIATDGIVAIVDATPVDSTKAVSNWKVAHGSAFSGIVGPRIPGSKAGSGAGAAKNAMKAEGKGRIKFFKSAVSMYISNRVPYIGLL